MIYAQVDLREIFINEIIIYSDSQIMGHKK
jgi:hypothetical protein